MESRMSCDKVKPEIDFISHILHVISSISHVALSPYVFFDKSNH